MTRRSTTLLSAALLAIALPVSAVAQAPGANFFANWDYDGDGKVTVEEVLERRGDLFDGFDVDENGILSAEELADHNAMRDAMQDTQDRPMMQGQRFGRGGGGRFGGGPRGPMMQAPGYGFGPQQGYGYGPQQGYGYGPGWGQPQGMMQPGCCQGQGLGPQWTPRTGPQGFGPQMGPQGWGQQFGQPGMGPQQMQQQMGAMLDADRDGQISRDEFVEAGKAWLPRFDRNGDGIVDASDFPGLTTQ